MRRALLVAILVAGCATPAGAPVDVCDGSWREVESVIVIPGGSGERPVDLACIRQVDDRRVRIGFEMPGGPDCLRLSRLELVESGDAVSIALFVAANDDPAAGACAPGARRVATEVDLQAPVDDRALLDGNAVLEPLGSSG